MSEPGVRPGVGVDDEAALPSSVAEERGSVATQWQLKWWRFKKHLPGLGVTDKEVFVPSAVVAESGA